MTRLDGGGSDSDYQYLLDNYPHALSFLDLQGGYQEVNTRVCKLTGRAREQLLGSHYIDHITKADRARVEHTIQSALKGSPAISQHGIVLVSGDSVDVFAIFLPFIRQNQTVGLYCMEENVSEQRALEDSERHYRSLFEHNPHLIYSTDRDGNITDANRAAEVASGMNRKDLAGISIFDFALESERDTLKQYFEQLKAGHSVSYNLTYTQADGSPGELAITAVPIFEGNTVVGTHSIAKDISEQRRFERLLTERVKELQCIRVVTEILETANNLQAPTLEKIASAIQAGFQYPDITGVRVSLAATHIESANFRESEWQLSEAIVSGKQRMGAIDVVYLEQRPDETEGPFLAEERDLLRIIAGKLQGFYDRETLSEELRLAANALNSTAEGVMVLDNNARVVMVNPAYLELTGYREDELKDKVMRYSPDHSPMSVKEWLQAVDEGGPSLRGESWYHRKDGSRIPVLASISAIRNNNGETTHYVVIYRDISEQRHVQERLDYLSLHDTLTNLPNREFLAKIGTEGLAEAKQHGRHLAVGFLDLDHFKQINDSMGRDAGNELLIKAGDRLLQHVKDSDTVARLGGDEFGLVLPNLTQTEDVRVAAARIIKAFHDPFEIAGQEVAITTSLGMAVFPADGDDFQTLLRDAELAMYSAKTQGRISYRLYSRELEQEYAGSRSLLLRTAMHRALEREEFRLHFQPIVNLATGRITGMEALIRWHNEELGVVPPSEFIPLAEETGLIYAIGEWVLRDAVRQMATLVRAGYKQLRVAVNLSARQFQEANLVSHIRQYLEDEGLAPHHLELEITETLMMYSMENTVTALRGLHELGVSVALDDFGTGYSSLQYLKDFHIQHLKIDKSFIDGLPLGARDAAITMAIVSMARALGIKVIAEGVEEDEQLAFLRDIGCEEAQGYYLSMPLQGDDLRWLLDNHDTLPVCQEHLGA